MNKKPKNYGSDPTMHPHKQAILKALAGVSGDIENSIGQLVEQIKTSSESSDKLGAKIFWLNIVLTGATLTLAIVETLINLDKILPVLEKVQIFFGSFFD